MGRLTRELLGAPELHRAIDVVATKDSGAFRQQVFADLASRKRAIRAAIAAHRSLPEPLSSLLVAGYGVRSFVGLKAPPGDAPIIAVAAYRNEERQFEQLEQVLGPDVVARIRIDLATLLDPSGWRELGRALLDGRAGAYLALVRQGNAGRDFLVACRVASTVAYFLRFLPLLQDRRPRAVLVSSDSNPYAMGLTFAARRLGIRTIYVTHGHIPDGPPPLMFDLSILDGPALLQVYEEMGPTEGDVVFRGCEGRYRPLKTAGLRRPGPVVGVFCSLIVDWARLGRLVGDLRRTLQPSRIVLRLHPNTTIRDPHALDHVEDHGDLQVSSGDRILLEDAERCDVVFAGNSSCHLTVLKYGVPTVYLPGLDKVPHDFYRFIERRIVPAFDAPGDVDLDAVADFYEDPAWAERFARFDAAYPMGADNLDEDVRRAVTALLEAA